MLGRAVATFALLAIFALPANAQDAAAATSAPGGEPASQLGSAQAASESRRVAVLMLATPGVSSETTDSLTEALIGSLAARGGVRIVGKEEFQAQLRQGEQGTLECVSSAACLGRVGVELGVAEVIAGTLAQRGGRWVFNLNRIDMSTGSLEGRVFREVAGDEGALADAVIAAVPQLYVVVRRPATLSISATVTGAEVLIDGILVGTYTTEPVRQEDIPPGRHEVTVRARGYHDYHRVANVREGTQLEIDADPEPIRSRGISPLVWIGGGVAIGAAGAGAVFAVLARRSPPAGASRAEVAEFFDARDTESLIANIAFAVAGAGALTAIIGIPLSGGASTDGAPSARARVSPTPGGLELAVDGVF